MAGKPKTSKTSKTAKASMRAGAAKGPKPAFERAADDPLFAPLDGGRSAYVFSFSGRTLRLRVASAEFVAAVAEMHALRPQQVTSSLQSLDERFPGCGYAAAIPA